MIIIAGSGRVTPETIASLLGVASDIATKSRLEAGCVEYRFSIDIDDSNVVRLFEIWDSVEARNNHFATEHFATFGAAIADALAEPPEFSRYEASVAGPLPR